MMLFRPLLVIVALTTLGAVRAAAQPAPVAPPPGPTVDAWNIQSAGSPGAGATIAESDRLVLHTRTIQGSVEYSEDTYVGTPVPTSAKDPSN